MRERSGWNRQPLAGARASSPTPLTGAVVTRHVTTGTNSWSLEYQIAEEPIASTTASKASRVTFVFTNWARRAPRLYTPLQTRRYLPVRCTVAWLLLQPRYAASLFLADGDSRNCRRRPGREWLRALTTIVDGGTLPVEYRCDGEVRPSRCRGHKARRHARKFALLILSTLPGDGTTTKVELGALRHPGDDYVTRPQHDRDQYSASATIIQQPPTSRRARGIQAPDLHLHGLRAFPAAPQVGSARVTGAVLAAAHALGDTRVCLAVGVIHPAPVASPRSVGVLRLMRAHPRKAGHHVCWLQRAGFACRRPHSRPVY